MRGKEPVIGVIREFAAGNTFLGVVGKGVFVNGLAVQPAWATELMSEYWSR